MTQAIHRRWDFQPQRFEKHCDTTSQIWTSYKEAWKKANCLRAIGIGCLFLPIFQLVILEKIGRIFNNVYLDVLNRKDRSGGGREHRLIFEDEKIKCKLNKWNAMALHQMEKQEDNPNSKYWDEELKSYGLPFQDLSFQNNDSQRISTKNQENVGVAWAQGKRDAMEDAHCMEQCNVSIGGDPFPVRLYAVFDGHSVTGHGAQISQFVSKKIKEQFIYVLKTLQQKYPNFSQEAYLWNALKIVFVTLNDQYFNQSPTQYPYCYTSGTTATLTLIVGEGDGAELWTANVGDSRAILVNGNETIQQLTSDQKPKDPLFIQPIKARGGTVDYEHDRIKSSNPLSGLLGPTYGLGMARAVGDLDYDGDGISARAKVTRMPLSTIEPNSYLVIACDGVWDNASTRQIGRKVCNAVNVGDTCEKIAADIVYSSLKTSPHDNNTAMVVKIK